MKNETNHLPIVLARKPISEKTIAENVLRWGTGGINIDGCRVEGLSENELNWTPQKQNVEREFFHKGFGGVGIGNKMEMYNTKGRFPANIIFDEEAGQLLDEQSGDSKSQGGKGEKSLGTLGKNGIYNKGWGKDENADGLGGYGDTGGASRFFYNVNLINEDKINKQINEKGKRMKNENVKLMLGDNIEKLRELPDNFVDSIITDPPYGLSFMNKKWDYDVPSIDFWKEALRVLKPGGHVLSFGGTRTYHRMVVNMEDAGFEIRDQIMWVYGSGFPKSHNIGKAVDKIEGNDREIVREETTSFKVNNTKENNVINVGTFANNFSKQTDENGYRINTITKGQSDYEGWGTALKPANEPICVARKPLSEKTIAENVLKHGTGGINIDGCRIGYAEDDKTKNIVNYNYNLKDKQSGVMYHNYDDEIKPSTGHKEKMMVFNNEGRFPAYLIIECTCDEVIPGNKGEVVKSNRKRGLIEEWDGGHRKKPIEAIDNYNDKGDIHTNPDCPCRLLDEQSGDSKSQGGKGKATQKSLDRTDIGYGFKEIDNAAGLGGYGDTGGASRFFYVAKVSKKERNMGLDNFEEKEMPHGAQDKCGKCNKQFLAPKNSQCVCEEPERLNSTKKNTHPTIKPINLLTYLVRLITPQNGIVMDCYMGSGSTGIAALLEGFQFIGMEMDEEYFNIAEARIDNYELYKDLVKKK